MKSEKAMSSKGKSKGKKAKDPDTVSKKSRVTKKAASGVISVKGGEVDVPPQVEAVVVAGEASVVAPVEVTNENPVEAPPVEDSPPADESAPEEVQSPVKSEADRSE